MRIKVRMEMQLEIGDKVMPAQAAAEAAQDFVDILQGGGGADQSGFVQASVFDVTRGKMAFVIERG